MATDLSVSFAPDGTDVAGLPSQLHQQLDAVAPTDAWQAAIVQALQTWMTYLHAKATVVNDSGDPLGTLGQTQGDTRFGDVRIGAIPLAADVVAFAVPHSDVISGTWSGDILFNSNVALTSVDEVFRVALHEAGHVLGLPENTDPNSPLFATSIPTATTPTPGDIAALERLYGQPGNDGDQGEGDADNDDVTGAVPLSNSTGTFDAIRYEVTGAITSPTDIDFYQLTPLSQALEDLQVLTVTVRSTTAPGLIPHVEILTPMGRTVESKVLSNVNGELVVQTTDVEPGRAYILKVQAVDPSGSFATGSYHLSARFGTQATSLTHLVRGRLDSTTPSQVSNLRVNQTALMHLVLRAPANESGSPVIVWAVISDVQGNIVARIATPNGDARSAPSVVMLPGNYRVEIQAASPSGGRFEETSFSLDGGAVSLPIGIDPIDPTGSPTTIVDPTTGDVLSDPWVTSPIIAVDPAPPPDAPMDPPPPPWEDPDWWYWYLLGLIPDLPPPDVSGESPPPGYLSTTPVNSWNNVVWAVDVDGNKSLSPLDALLVINWLNAKEAVALGDHTDTDPLLDVNDDGSCTPVDALLVINALNAAPTSSNAEGEGVSTETNTFTSSASLSIAGVSLPTVGADDFALAVNDAVELTHLSYALRKRV